MSQKRMSPYTLPNVWKLPLSLAVCFHLLILFGAMVLPGLLNQQTILPDIITIDLVNIEGPAAKNEPAAPPVKQAAKEEAAPPAPPQPAAVIKPEVTKQIPPPVEAPAPIPVPPPEPEPVTVPESAAPPPAPAEAISIKPLKQKLKKEIKEIPDTRVEDARIRKDELKNIARKLQEEARQEIKREEAAQETIRKQRQLAAAREEARQAELEARMAAADAKNALREQLRAATSASTSLAASSQSTTSNSQNMSIVEQQYHVTVGGHIQQYWQPPDIKTWDPNLFVLVSITIASDGQIVSQVIDQGSGDNLFDQFVLKTLEAANPVLPPPPALQKQRIELSFRFKPSGIQ